MVAAAQPTPAYTSPVMYAVPSQQSVSQTNSQDLGQVTNRLLDILQARQTSPLPSQHQGGQSLAAAAYTPTIDPSTSVQIPYQAYQQISQSPQSYGAFSNNNRAATAQALGLNQAQNQNAEVEQYINWLENQLRANNQVLQIADQIAQVYQAQEYQLQIADQIAQVYQAQEYQLQIADQIAQRFESAIATIEQYEIALQQADNLANYTQGFEAIAQVEEYANALVQEFAKILLDPDECAAWYLDLDPPQQQLPTVSRPEFPAVPAPRSGGIGDNASQFRQAYGQDPSQAWRFLG